MFEEKFAPPWLIANPHVQTIYPAVSHYPSQPLVWYTIELADHDHVDVATLPMSCAPHAPWVILIPGLEGSVESHYIKRLLPRLVAHGYQPWVLHHRGCSPHSPQGNRLWRSYHSNDQAGLSALYQWLNGHDAHRPIAAIGYSMGGNLLANYVANNTTLRCAALISPPLDLQASAQQLNAPKRWLYRRYLLNSLKKRLKHKIVNWHEPVLTLEDVAHIRTIDAFDELYTAPASGYQHAIDYYQQASCLPRLKQITTPTWLLRAQDDPVVDASPVDLQQQLSESITYTETLHGGHVGFLNSLRGEDCYLDQALLRWLDAQIK